MKNILLTLSALIFCSFLAFAQQIPQGMKYQAIARDLDGSLLANEKIILQINLQGDEKSSEVYYSETQTVTTNNLGLFSIVIGNGKGDNSKFVQIPWSSQNIWMSVAIFDEDSNQFKTISNSQLLAVPYAFHSGTATKLTEENLYSRPPKNNDGEEEGAPSQAWLLFGNSETDPTTDKLGTTDEADLVFVTNNLERLRITSAGEILTGEGKFTIGGNLEVQGDETRINKDLFVGRNVYLNNDDALGGQTINYGNFTVADMSPTYLTGVLDVDKAVNFEDVLNVNNGSKTTLSGDLDVLLNSSLGGTLDVTGITNLEDELTVKNQSSTVLSGTLDVGLDATFNKNITVTETVFAGTLNTDNLIINSNTPNGAFLATFTNTNEGSGDGIKIKLGRTHPGWDGAAFINAPNPLAEFFDLNVQNIRGAITGGDPFTITDALSLIPSAVITGTVCNLAERIAIEINDKLGLDQVNFPGLTDRSILVAINGFDPADESPDCTCNPLDISDTPFCSFGDCLIDDDAITNITNPTTIIPAFSLALPEEFCPDFLPTLSMPNINFANVNNSLTNANHFIDFTDKEDRALGYVRAVSITEWGNNYFNGTWATQFIQKGVAIDPLDAITGLINVGTEIIDNYNSIGVEYASGNGDYAEWLERIDPKEYISKGDIVGVVGGKISKDLANAEQIMAISEKPIVLGNMPVENKTHLGNNVAFMGQIPVKVIGPVNSGDYIIADTKVPGYGQAKSPNDISIEDTKYIVGRSWETKLEKGPKLVNTVIGVHNGDYLKIIQKFQDNLKNTEERLNDLEAKVEILFNNSSN